MSKKSIMLLALLVFLPVLAVLAIYVTGPRLMRGKVQSPPITENQMSEAESKVQLDPSASPAKPSTLNLTATDVNALVQKAIREEKAVKDARVTLRDGSAVIEGVATLPSDQQQFPVLLRGLAGKDVGVLLELKPQIVGGEVYVKIENANVGVFPVPVNMALSFLPQSLAGKFTYTEHGVRINDVVGDDVDISKITVTPDNLEIRYNIRP